MYYGNIKKFSIENGPGVRVSLFVSGCRNHCKNCFNPETWNFEYGKEFTTNTVNEIITELKQDHCNGLTILGGEPLEPENQEELLNLINKVKKEVPNKTIWLYTGFTLFYDETNEFVPLDMYEEHQDSPLKWRASTEISNELLSKCNVIIDGRFIEELKNISLAFRGSENQRIIDVKNTIKNKEITELKI